MLSKEQQQLEEQQQQQQENLSQSLLLTAGMDKVIKLFDLRKPDKPIYIYQGAVVVVFDGVIVVFCCSLYRFFIALVIFFNYRYSFFVVFNIIVIVDEF